VVDKLRSGWSPEQIAGRLPKDHSDKSIHWETIYRLVYSDQGKHKGLYEYLPRKHKKRAKKYGRTVRRSRIPDRVSIHERPKEVEKRSTFGHWEGDSVVGKWHKSGIHTQVERKTRFIAAKLIKDFTADETVRAQKQVFNHLPEIAKKSTTVDNGKEFTNHKQFELPVYFCDPYASWQKATNENTNGLIRRYLPKKTDFRTITQKDLDDIVEEINNRPRKCLNYQTPLEAFTNELSVAIEKRM
jgi:IS30 family transposase